MMFGDLELLQACTHYYNQTIQPLSLLTSTPSNFFLSHKHRAHTKEIQISSHATANR